MTFVDNIKVGFYLIVELELELDVFVFFFLPVLFFAIENTRRNKQN